MRTAVIGAGAVGSYIAWKLSDVAKVTLFSWKKQEKACSGLFSSRIFEFIPLPLSLIENRISTIEIHFPKKKTELLLAKEIFVVNRKGFDEFLFNLAKERVKIIERKVEKVNENAEVFFSGRRKKFDLLIACDGALSAVRKSLSLPDPEFYFGLQLFINKKDFSNKAITWATEHGFFWKIPRGKRVEYGIMEKPECAKQKFYTFCKRLKIRASNLRGALIPIGPVISPYEKIFLCGDAAGICKPWSGGGIVWSFEAAEILLKYFPDLEKASRVVKKVFERRIKFYRVLGKSVRVFHFALPRKIKVDPDKIFMSFPW